MDKNKETHEEKLGWTYGGQAVMEGVMMRGPHVAAVAVRRPSDKEIVVKQEPVSKLYRGPISKIPFLRGIPMLWDALGLGMQALFYSAEVVGQDEDPDFTLEGGTGIATGALSLLIALGLFMLLPSWVAGLVVKQNDILFNLLEAGIRLSLLIAYMSVVGRIEEIRRVFAYHGAEHKTINAYEDGAPLTVAGVRPYPTAHARCGTAFLLMVALISFLIFAPLGRPSLPVRLLSRLVMIPVITGIAYELLRFTGRHSEHPLIRWLIKPNLALQRLTTREPDDEMVEVAITALQTVLEQEPSVGQESTTARKPSPSTS
jgi:uncharacterized protein YqhQ